MLSARNARRLSTDPETRQLAQVLAASVAVPMVAFATFDAFSFAMAASLTFLIIGCVGAFWRLAGKNWRTGVREIRGSLSRRAFLAEARTYLPWLETGDVMPAPSGVRAQAVDPDGSLVDDFRINRVGDVTSVRNAPSPAATASMAIAEHIVASLDLPLDIQLDKRARPER